MSKVKFPLSDIKFHNIPVVGQFYTKQEVDKLMEAGLSKDLGGKSQGNSCVTVLWGPAHKNPI